MAKPKITIECQINRANAILNNLRPLVTEQDRKDAQQKLNLSMQTIKTYLIGQAKNIDTALLLIGFFRGRIQAREQELKTA